MYIFRKNSFTLLIFLLLIMVATSSKAQLKSFRIIGYVPNWIDVTAFAQGFDFKQVTHLNYAFQNPNAAGDLVESNDGLTVLVAKAHQNKVKVLVSFGGASSAEGTLKNHFQNLISTSDKRAAFIHKIAVYLYKYQLDGLDVDEEGPAINSNYEAFIKQLADTLKPKGKLLTAVVGWGAENILNSTLPLFDWINLMAYDYTGDWDLSKPGQHSPYWYAQQMINDWKKRGVKKENLCLGVPFYGYGFYKSAGNYNYIDIIAKYSEAWQKDQVGDTIYYNGMTTIWKKTKLALKEASGIMIWELSNDAKGDKSLLKVISLTVDSLQTSAEINLNQPRGLMIFSNPVNSQLVIENLSIEQPSTIEVINIQGSLLQSRYLHQNRDATAQINISSLSQGAYICRVTSPEGIQSKLFIKE